jgi:hypothetical protein
MNITCSEFIYHSNYEYYCNIYNYDYCLKHRTIIDNILFNTIILIIKTLYKIRQKDCEWNINRRYSQLVQFHTDLLNESILETSQYPPLPKKRWFEISRWIQRYVIC